MGNGALAMPETTDDYTSLLARARQGDAEAMSQLCQLYEKELRIVARVQLGPALRPYLDSIDLVQSVHRSLLLGLRENKFEIATPTQLLALALTMVRRKVARHWRRMQRQPLAGLSPGGPAANRRVVPGRLPWRSRPWCVASA